MVPMKNLPEVKLGLVTVSRGRLPTELPRARSLHVLAECEKRQQKIIPCEIIVRNEREALAAAAEMAGKGVDAAVIYLGNFGPEGPIAILAQNLRMPFMLCGAAEESQERMSVTERGDAFCGLLNASINCELRQVRPYIPERPIGRPSEIASLIEHFGAIARVIVGVRRLKIISFGPRPADFFVCTAPIKPLYDLGIEMMENSELDMLQLYNSAASRRSDIEAVVEDMTRELGAGNVFPEKLQRMAQFEVALSCFMEENLGSRQFGVFANRCWPAFARSFGFVPCYVNGRLAGRGIPAACETDIYGALSQYMAQLASLKPTTILDVNNNIPDDLEIPDTKGVDKRDLFMGYHCGNTPTGCMQQGYAMSFQPVMNRLIEEGRKPEVTCGIIQGRLMPGPMALFRIHSTPGLDLRSYIAEGHVLDAGPRTFGGIGVIAIGDFMRFYRHVLIGRGFPHHGALGFGHIGRVLFDALRGLGVTEIQTPRPVSALYPDENPFTVESRES